MYADSALIIAFKNDSRKQTLKLYNLLADISYASQDFRAAHQFEEKEDALRDSINADNLLELSTEFETKYETEKKKLKFYFNKINSNKSQPLFIFCQPE